MSAIDLSSVIDAFYLCLAGSLIWAPLVFLGALWLAKRAGDEAGAAIWPSALVISALPALAAPIAAAFGLSLRGAPAPLPPMMPDHHAPMAAMPVITDIAATPPPPSIDLAMILSGAAALYFYGFILFAAVGAIRLISFSFHVRNSYPIDDARLRAALEEWRKTMGVSPRVRFAYCDAVSSVCVHGFLRPVVLMPPSLLNRVTTENAILMGAHELAHVKRGDTWLFALCSLAKALFWFNPFMRQIIAHAQLAAEQSADALVIARGANRKSYARCFVEGLKISSGLDARAPVLVPSFTAFDKRSRRERLNAILSGRANGPSIGLGGKIILAASGMLAMTIAFGQAALAVSPPPARDALTVVPAEGRITSTFGERTDPWTDKKSSHYGIDIGAPKGTPVYAAGDGKVITSEKRTNYGHIIDIDHGHGLVTRYSQLNKRNVKVGKLVKAGDQIAEVGSSGRSTGPHLHFEIMLDGKRIDPWPVVRPGEPSPHVEPKKRKALFAPEPLQPSAAPAPTRYAFADIEPAPEPLPILQPAPAPFALAEPTPMLSPEPAPKADKWPEPAKAPAPDDAPAAPRFPDMLEDLLVGGQGDMRLQLDQEFITTPDGFIAFQDLEALSEIKAIERLGSLEGLEKLKALEHLEEVLVDFEIAETEFQFPLGEDFKAAYPDAKVITEFYTDGNGQSFVYSFGNDSDSEEVQKAIEQARREAEKAHEEAMREDAERQREMVERQQEMLERQHEQTERQREQLERQLEQVERQRELIEREREKIERRREKSERQHEQTERQREQLERQLEQADRQQEMLERQHEQAERQREEFERQLEQAERQREMAEQQLEREKERMRKKMERKRRDAERKREENRRDD